MKSSFIYYIGAAFAAIAIAYALFKHITESGSTSDTILKKKIGTLSFELIRDEAKELVKQLDPKHLSTDEVLNFALMPTKLSKSFYKQPDSDLVRKNLELTDDELERMVFLSLRTTDRVLISEVLIFDDIAKDYLDAINEDTVFIERIKLK